MPLHAAGTLSFSQYLRVARPLVHIINHPKTDGINIVRIFYSLVQQLE